jgi:hypothetical protein
MSLMLFYGLTLPQLQERGVVVGIMCFWGVCGTLLGMPMLVTGRVRQKPYGPAPAVSARSVEKPSRRLGRRD